jgi:transposase
VDHCAIDLGGRKSQVCVRAPDGHLLFEGPYDTPSLPEFLRLLPRSRVIVETAAEAFRIADAAKEAGHEVRVVPATLVRSLGVGARKTKTDKRDARALSEVSCRIDLPSVHIPSARSREWKTICGMHDALITARTKLVNNLRGWLRGQGLRIGKGKAETFAQRMMQFESLPDYVTDQVEALAALDEKIRESEKRIKELAKDELCQRLMTVPGVGPSTSVRFVAAIDDVTRFDSAHKVESYFGLVPGESSSSERQQRLSITKAGPPSVRWVLGQAAWALQIRCRDPAARPLQLWAAEIARKHGKRIATIALARKLAGILYALWRDGTTYQRCLKRGTGR